MLSLDNYYEMTKIEKSKIDNLALLCMVLWVRFIYLTSIVVPDPYSANHKTLNGLIGL